MSERKPVHTYEFTSQETQLDTFGHINHATYLVIFEQARWDWITAGGFGMKDIHAKQIGPTILELNIQYKREIGPREKIRIESYVTESASKTCKIEQHMINESGKLCTVLKLTVGIFDMKIRRLVDAPPEWQKIVSQQ